MWKCNNETQGHSSCMLVTCYLCIFHPSWISILTISMPFDYQLTQNRRLLWSLYIHWSKFWVLTISLENNNIYEQCSCISFSSPFTFIGTYIWVCTIHPLFSLNLFEDFQYSLHQIKLISSCVQINIFLCTCLVVVFLRS